MFEVISSGDIAIIISIISATVALLSFVLSWRKSKMEKLTHESQFISGILHEFSLAEEKFLAIKNVDDCLSFVGKYLNILDKLCYFDAKGYLSDDIMNFFKNYMEFGLGCYNWLSDIDFNKPLLEESYSNVTTICKKRGIVPVTKLGAIFEEHREKILKRKGISTSS